MGLQYGCKPSLKKVLKTQKKICNQTNSCYYTHMTANDIMTRPTDTYFVVTAALYSDPLTRWTVGGGSNKGQAISIASSVQSGVVDGFASETEAFESFPELAPASERVFADAAAADEWHREMRERGN